MSDQSQMYDQMTFADTTAFTSSRAFQDGTTHSTLPDGLTTNPSGPEARHASRSVSPGKDEASTTSGTYGPPCPISLRSAALCESLGSKLQMLLGTAGSTWYAQTWRLKTTPLGLRFWAHTASALRTSGSGYTGLPTPSGVKSKTNHVVGRLDEWGGSSNPFRGTPLGKVRCASFELWMMGYPMEWKDAMVLATQSFPKSRRRSSAQA